MLKIVVKKTQLRNEPIRVETLEDVEIKNPVAFENLNYMAYNKLDIIKMYNTLYKAFLATKALAEERDIQLSIYEKKLKDNNIDSNLDEDEVGEYVARSRALVLKASTTFQEELKTELSVFDEQINYEVLTQLQKVKNSYKNTSEFSVVKINLQIDRLDEQLARISERKTMSDIDKTKLMVMLSEQIRKLHEMKEKLLGRDVKKLISVNYNNASPDRQQNTEVVMNWEEIKSSVAIGGNNNVE